jgi:hypothetical protein
MQRFAAVMLVWGVAYTILFLSTSHPKPFDNKNSVLNRILAACEIK